MGVFAENKQRFATATYANKGTGKTYASILRIFNDKEEEIGKDLYHFDAGTIIDVLETSKYQKPQLKTAYKKYMEWGIRYFKQPPEHGQIDLGELLTEYGLDEKNSVRDLENIFTRYQMVHDIVPKIFEGDFINKAIILLAFEGIGSIKELLELRIDAINDRWITTSSGRKLLLTESAAWHVKEAIRQKDSYDGNGKSRSMRDSIHPLSDTGFLIRSYVNGDEGKFKKGSFGTRLNILKRYTNFPKLSFTRIHKSGILDYFFLVESRTGKKLSAEDAKRVCIWFGEDPTKNNKWSLQLRNFYNDEYKPKFLLGVNELEERKNDDEFDAIYEEIAKIQLDKRTFSPSTYKSLLRNVHKAITQHPDPGSLSEEDLKDLAFQKSVANGTRATLKEGPIDIPPPDISTGSESVSSRYPRNSDIAKTALEDAHYLCSVDPEHLSFISRITNTNFVEAHHLIPMSAQDGINIEYSLDVPENIFSLCPTCHRAVHHATPKAKREIIEKLYSLARVGLKSRGILISLEDLLLIYGVRPNLV